MKRYICFSGKQRSCFKKKTIKRGLKKFVLYKEVSPEHVGLNSVIALYTAI